MLYKKAGTSREEVFKAIDPKLNYTHPKYRNAEERGETFLPACWEFITFNSVFVLLTYGLLRCGYTLFRRIRLSWAKKLLRPFSIWLYMTPLMLDGNLQYFCFLLFSQISMGFSLNPRDKALNVLSYLIFFVVIFLSIVSCFLAYWKSSHLAKYILDNWKARLLTNTVRMLILGGIHSLLRSHSAHLPILMGC